MNITIKTPLFLCLALLVIGLNSCSSKYDNIRAKTNDFFDNMEQELAAVSDGEEFMAFFDKSEESRSKFTEYLDKKLSPDNDGIISGMTADESRDLLAYIQERNSSFDRKSSEKFSQFVTPLIDKLEAAVNEAHDRHKAVEDLSYEDFHDITSNILDIDLYSEYDKVPKELQERYSNIIDLWEEMKYGEEEDEYEE